MKDDLQAGYFESDDGCPRQGQEAIIPILKFTESPVQLTCIGTGFFISASGVFVTAAHVVKDVLDAYGKPDSGLTTVQFIPPNIFIRRDIIKVSYHTRSDVAVGGLSTLINKTTGIPLRNKALVLTSDIPGPGEKIASWAYPNIVTAYSRVKNSTSMELAIRPQLYTGTIEERHLEGRDRSLLPCACYQTDLAIEGGASGGPVFDSRGRVFAVNSTGFNGSPTSYASFIQPIGGLPVADYQTEDGVLHKNITTYKLMELGHVVVESSSGAKPMPRSKFADEV